MEVEALLFNGNNHGEVEAFMTGAYAGDTPNNKIFIHTPAGIMFVDSGDYIVKDIRGEFTACKPDIFEAIYEKVE